MITLTRRVRLGLNLGDTPEGTSHGYSGRPAIGELGALHELCVSCAGVVGRSTGYLVDIKTIDQVVRAAALPLLEQAFRTPAGVRSHALLASMFEALAPRLPPRLAALRWLPSPYHWLEMNANDPGTVRLAQRFDFAAAHRLHSPALSDEENRRLYGKCNNPRGHGHNYQFEPVVRVPLSRTSPAPFTHADLARLCEREILTPFDHTHLNEDTPEFDTRIGGVIPSVENIARVFFERLERALPSGVRLEELTVWETDRTSATWRPATP